MDLMKKVFAILFVSSALFMCAEENVDKEGCGTRATVRDLTGLDGCGFVFELEDGTRLEPVFLFWCGTPPISEEQQKDPLYNFEFVDGKQVLIDYELSTSPSICMVGQTVKITCLTELPLPAQE
jgi:hypothetical protein